MSKPARHTRQPRTPVEKFLRLPEENEYRLELVRGQVVREPRPGGRHGQVLIVLGAALHQQALVHGLGSVLGDTGYVLNRAAATIRVPDLSFVSAQRIGRGSVPWGLLEGAPDLAVEILSPSNRAGEMREKVADYLAAGCRLVWVVDAARRRVTVHEPGEQTTSLQPPDALDGGTVLPGFRLPLAELFSG